MPEVFADLKAACAKLEAHFRDIQDIEFTVEEGKLWMLQSRSGKRSMQAALKIAVDMTGEGLITEKEAVLGIDAAQLDQLLHPTLDPDTPKLVIGKGLPASPGAASGELVFDADEAVHLKAQGHTLILARVETSPEDVQGMHAAAGIITTRGGMTSHAAVVARGMGRPCVVGAASVQIELERETLTAGGETLTKGDIVTIDGSTGQIIKGRVPMREPTLSSDFVTLMGWADSFRRMKVRANADTPADARQSLRLRRRRHRALPHRAYVLRGGPHRAHARDDPRRRHRGQARRARQAAPHAAPGLHRAVRDHGRAAGDHSPARSALARISAPWRGGHRRGRRRHGGERCKAEAPGRRLARIQSDARPSRLASLGELPGDHRDAGACDLRGGASRPASSLGTRRHARDHGAARHGQGRARPRQGPHRRHARTRSKTEQGVELTYSVGTMVELPRACINAGEIGKSADFFSFGTNDLTQTTFGLSRDDAGRFLGEYTEKGIIQHDPFVTLDPAVGELMWIAVERGRRSRPDLKIGICGEHGGDPETIKFCEDIRPRLCVLLALPGASGAARRGPGGLESSR